MNLHSSKKNLDNPYHHSGGYFDEMDAFNPIAIENEYRWQSQHSRSQNSKGSGLLRRIHYRADGIPKVINVEVEDSTSSVTQTPRSLTITLMPAHNCLDIDQDRTSGRPRKSPQEVHPKEKDGFQERKKIPRAIDSLQSSQDLYEGPVDELLVEALLLDEKCQPLDYGGPRHESSSPLRSRSRLRSLKNRDSNSSQRSLRTPDRFGAQAHLAGHPVDYHRRHASLSPRREKSSLRATASMERSAVVSLSHPDLQSAQSFTGRISQSSINASRNVGPLKETSERCQKDRHQQDVDGSDPYGKSSNASRRSADCCTSFASSMETLTFGRSVSQSASTGNGSRDVSKKNLSVGSDKPSNSKYIDLPTRSTKNQRSKEQNPSQCNGRSRGNGKLKAGSQYMNQIFKSVPQIPDHQIAMATYKRSERNTSYMDSLFGQDGPEIGVAIRNTTTSRVRSRR